MSVPETKGDHICLSSYKLWMLFTITLVHFENLCLFIMNIFQAIRNIFVCPLDRFFLVHYGNILFFYYENLCLSITNTLSGPFWVSLLAHHKCISLFAYCSLHIAYCILNIYNADLCSDRKCHICTWCYLSKRSITSRNCLFLTLKNTMNRYERVQETKAHRKCGTGSKHKH